MMIFDGALAPAMLPVSAPLTAPALLHLVDSWARHVPEDAVDEPFRGARSSRVLCTTETYDVWVVRWAPGSRSGPHEHGLSAGAISVVAGELRTTDLVRPTSASRRSARLVSGRGLFFAPHHVHDVENASSRFATSVHVYSPPLAG